MSDIQQGLMHDEHRVYRQAVNELGSLPREEAVRTLRDVAKTSTGRARARIMNPLREYDPATAASLALEILDDTDARFHADALYTLWKLNNPAGVERAAKMLLSHHDSITRIWSATYLGTCGNRELIPTLELALNDSGADEEGREVREVAEQSIAEILAAENGGDGR